MFRIRHHSLPSNLHILFGRLMLMLLEKIISSIEFELEPNENFFIYLAQQLWNILTKYVKIKNITYAFSSNFSNVLITFYDEN